MLKGTLSCISVNPPEGYAGFLDESEARGQKIALSVVSKTQHICNVGMSERDEPNSFFSLDHTLLLIHECEKI